MRARDRLRRAIPAGPIGWAAYLACSWTWCIGMFLPVLMLRDYGAWGWLVFAVPNVVGAAAMGWMLRDPEASRAMQQAHTPACRAFSLVTLAFHAYFVIGLLPRLLGEDVIWLSAALTLPFLLLLRARGRGARRATLSSGGALAVSVLAMLAVIAVRGLPSLPVPTKSRTDLLWLSPVIAFGFLLDPYLDLTFHRARQSTTRAGGRTAFGLGFGVFFLVMIVFTAIYAPAFIDALATGRRLSPRRDLFAAVLVIHICLQTAFTVAAHLDALAATDPPGPSPSSIRLRWLSMGGAVVLIALLLRLAQKGVPTYHGLTTGEVFYRLFLAFYGLLFPSYVWLFGVPRRVRGLGRIAGGTPTRGQVGFFAGVLVLAGPMYWMSFIEGRMGWAVPGVLLVLLARFVLPKPIAPMRVP